MKCQLLFSQIVESQGHHCQGSSKKYPEFELKVLEGLSQLHRNEQIIEDGSIIFFHDN